MEKEAKNKNNRVKSISCKECCRQMGDYIEGKLPVEDDIRFVAHIRSCKDCTEEFHNYYNFMTNLYFQNFGYNDDFPADEETLLKNTEEVLLTYRKRRRFFFTLMIIFGVVIGVMIVFLLLRDMGRL